MADADCGLSREECRQRRVQAKLVEKAVKQAARKSRWRFAGGVHFRDHDGWFVAVRSGMLVARRRTHATLHVKPMAIDPLFWNNVGFPENRKLPLSFRAHGAWICHVPPLSERRFVEDGKDSEQLAREIVDWSDRELARIDLFLPEDFLELLRDVADRCFGGLASLITALILLGREEEAATLVENARARGECGGFSVSFLSGDGKSFVDMAHEWLSRKRIFAIRR